MKYYLAKNSVIKNNLCTPNFSPIDSAKISLDIELEDDDKQKKDIYLGPNGIGKSFLWQNFTYLACLYKATKSVDGKIPNEFEIIQRLSDAKIGDVFNNGMKTSICRPCSYSPKSTNHLKKSEINYNLFYCAQLGKHAIDILNNYCVTYYTNSPYPSSISFFNKHCSSISSKDIDYVFWSIFRRDELENFFDTKIKLWINFSAREKELATFLNKEYIQGTKEHICKKYRNTIAYVDDLELKKCFSELEDYLATPQTDDKEIYPKLHKNSLVYRIYREFEIGPHKFPQKTEPSATFKLLDYILLLFIHEKNISYNYTLQINNIDIDLVNSGTKCDFVIKCLTLLNTNQKKQILIIDEPENSLHMNTQRNITKYIPNNIKIILITHSPSFVLNLLDEGPNNNLYVMVNENNSVKIENKELSYASLDDIAAEYFGYTPIISAWNKKNPIKNFNDANFISVNEFYEKIRGL